MRFRTKQMGPLKADEIHQGEQISFRFVQNESFPHVWRSIGNSREILKAINVANLWPFIGEDGTIRVKDGLKNSDFERSNQLYIVFENAHINNLHEGAEYVRNILQQKFWIIGLRNTLWKINSRFIKCRQRSAKPIHPPVADLLRERLDKHLFPFTHTGFDYFGPIEVTFLRRTLKG